jgi:hypothetical protein
LETELFHPLGGGFILVFMIGKGGVDNHSLGYPFPWTSPLTLAE